jgi:hypothetical protein
MMAMQIATLDHVTAIFLPSKYQGNGINFAFYNMVVNRTFIATPAPRSRSCKVEVIAVYSCSHCQSHFEPCDIHMSHFESITEEVLCSRACRRVRNIKDE